MNVIRQNLAGIHYYILVVLGLIVSVPIAFGQSSRVGINTSNPLAGLHVADSSVLFSGLNPLPGSPGKPPVSGAGTRMMWYADKAAFRAGNVDGTQWDKDSVGLYSFAVGKDVMAKGHSSVALGSNNSATHNATVALGSFNTASGNQSTAIGALNNATSNIAIALGLGNLASNFRSTATGAFTWADGEESFTSGYETVALGNSSFVGGYENVAKAFASFSIGRYSDTLGILSPFEWQLSDPVFAIGNGSSVSNRNNAMTVLKNGNVGIGLRNPSFRLHVANNQAGDGGITKGIMIENTSVTPGEAAISFKNASIPSSKQWIMGINETPPGLSFAYGPSFTTANTIIALDTNGRMGINNPSPQAPLHVIRNNPSGGLYASSPIAIFESNNISYIQLSHENTDETGFLSGNQVTSIRSALIFVADSSIDFRAGGNSTDLKISTEGNVGIGIYTPAAKLDVQGTVKLGTSGTVLNEIIKATVNLNLPSVAAGGTLAQSFTVTNATTTSAVAVSQAGSFNAGFIIASARVSAANTVEVRFVNTAGGSYDPPAMDYHFTIIR